MQSIKIFTENPDLEIEKYMVSVASFAPIEFYYFLSDNSDIFPKPNCLYIGTSKQIHLLCQKFSHGFLIHCITTDWNPEYMQDLNYDNINLLYIPMEPFSIYNAMNDTLGTYQYWLRVFTAPAEKTLAFILENAAKMLFSSIYVFNSYFSLIGKVLFSGCEPDDDILFNGKKYLSPDDVQELRNDPNVKFIPIKCGISTYAYALIFKTEKNLRLVSLLTDLFIKVLSEYLSDEISSKMNQSIQLEQFIHDTIELKIQSQKEINYRLSQIQMQPHTQMFCIVIQPSHKNNAIIPLNYIISRLNAIFQSGRFCIYKDNIVGMIGSNNLELPNHDHGAFNALLLQYEAYAGISNPTKHLEFFNVFYTMAKAALQFGTVFSDNDLQRVFYYEDYRLYHMVDLCKENFKTRYHHDNFIYLCHPAIITLYHYDQENSTDYFNVIYTYLLCDCSIMQSAQALNYHRNTLQNKLARIKKIIGLPLDSAVLKSTLYFSCIVMKYFKEYEHKNILNYSTDIKKEE